MSKIKEPVLLIVNYNDTLNTISLINKSINMNFFTHIIIVDNNSYDKQILNESVPNKKCTIIYSSSNEGYSRGNNIGLRYIHKNNLGKFVFISNPDVEFEASLCISMYETLLEYDEITCVTGIMKNSFTNNSNNSYWRKTEYLDDLMSLMYFTSKHVNKYNKYTYLIKKNLAIVDTIPGSFFALKLDDFINIELFDERIFLYHEEDIIAAKLKASNKKQAIVLDKFFYHKHKYTIETVMQYKRRFKSIFYYQKKYNGISIMKQIIMRLFYFIGLVEHKLLITLKKWRKK